MNARFAVLAIAACLASPPIAAQIFSWDPLKDVENALPEGVPNEGKIIQAGEDITSLIRAEDVSQAASQCAVFPTVRQALLERQHAFRQAPGLVADGRDMGSVVFPDARLKVYLTASVGERAKRRHKQLIEKGIPATIDGLLRDLKERDARDTGRADAPLVVAPDALVVDTSGLSVIDAIGAVILAYRKHP